MTIQEKLDDLFNVRSDDNLYNAWRAFSVPERDRLFMTLWRFIRQIGATRKDLEPCLRDALAEVTEEREETEMDRTIRKMGEEEINRWKSEGKMF